MISNTFLTGHDKVNPFKFINKKTVNVAKESTAVINALSLITYKAENNNPLCRLTNSCGNITNIPPVDPNNPTDPTTPSTDVNGYSAINGIINSVTFERLYKNIGSFPVTIDMSNKKLITKTYRVNGAETIVATIDRTIKNKITITLSGKTGYDKTLIKTIILEGSIIIDVIYTFGA